ncbi:MAG TPA: TolC family protein [Acidobacteriota bacterium]|jgi:outer membrane protein TolC|nr:TolC family protein [Acidobacteriota bacterium]
MKKSSISTELVLALILSAISHSFGQSKSPGRVEEVEKTASQAEAENVHVRSLVLLALQRSPELQAARHSIDVMQAKISPARTLPEPEIMFGQMNEGSIVPFTTLGDPDAGFSEVYIGFSQEVPFPGKLPLRGKIADMEARAGMARYKAKALELISQVKTAFYDLYIADKSIRIIEKERSLLEQFEKIASARYSVGKGIQQDVLEAQVETSKIEERLLTLRQRRGSHEAQLNALLNRAPDTPIGIPAEIEKSALRYTLSELNGLMERNFPLLEAQQRLIDREAFSLDLARKGKYPDFSFNFMYHNRGSNRPYWTIGGTMKVPLYYGRKQRYEVEGAAAGLAQSRKEYENLRVKTFSQIRDLYLMATTAEKLANLYDRGIIRQASFSLESAVDNYGVGKIDFLTLLTSWTRLLNYELTYYEQLAEFQKSLSRLEPLVGIELAKE